MRGQEQEPPVELSSVRRQNPALDQLAAVICDVGLLRRPGQVLAGQALDVDLPWSNPWSSSVDHVRSTVLSAATCATAT